ncbi:hypothetical protein V6956_004577 [Vibrio parahaemolyticus]|nr:hypothetical protein [Vibrio parahaemolyticus]EGR2836723.1 hypothetical protein [Vibrio parahaemolyticus]
MRLSHRRKRESKRGLYWPSRTKQARERREAMQRYVIKVARVAAETTAFASAVNQVVQACHAMRRGMEEVAKGIKTWLLPRDTSQQSVSAHRDGHAVTILVKTPQNDKI